MLQLNLLFLHKLPVLLRELLVREQACQGARAQLPHQRRVQRLALPHAILEGRLSVLLLLGLLQGLLRNELLERFRFGFGLLLVSPLRLPGFHGRLGRRGRRGLLGRRRRVRLEPLNLSAVNLRSLLRGRVPGRLLLGLCRRALLRLGGLSGFNLGRRLASLLRLRRVLFREFATREEGVELLSAQALEKRRVHALPRLEFLRDLLLALLLTRRRRFGLFSRFGLGLGELGRRAGLVRDAPSLLLLPQRRCPLARLLLRGLGGGRSFCLCGTAWHDMASKWGKIWRTMAPK